MMRWRRASLALFAGLLLAFLFACRAGEQIRGIKTELLDKPKTYKLEFRGGSTFRRGILQRAISEELLDFAQTGFPAAAIDDAAYTLETFYNDRGFPFTEVDYTLEKAGEGKPRAVFLIDEGPRTVVEEVAFRGNARFTAEDLFLQLRGPTTQALGLGKLYFVEAQAKSVARSVESLYYQSGFLDVRVQGPEITFDESRRGVSLAYEVIEGPRFLLSSIEIEPLEGHDTAGALAATGDFLGRPYFPRLAYEVRAAAEDHFAEEGYVDANSSFEESLDHATGEAKLTIRLELGELVRVHSLRVEGNTRTHARFILEQSGLEPGQLLTRSAEGDAFRSLYATGLFDSVDLKLDGVGTERDLVIVVSEVETLSVSAEVGYGAWERARVILGVRENNFLGTGRSLTMKAKLAERARGVTFYGSDPYTLSRRNVIGATAFWEEREQVSFDSQEVGAGLNLTHYWTRQLRNIYGYEYRISQSKNVDVVIPGLGPGLDENVNISALYVTNIYDTRDSFFLPRKGTWFRMRADFSLDELGTELPFVRLDGRIARYRPVTELAQVAWTFRAGMTYPLDDQGIPLQERYFNGGQNTVRSFREDELGPTDTKGNPIGGEAFTVISVELRQDLMNSFSAVLFADAGNVSLDYADVLTFRDVRYGVGPGIRWLLPIGPVRLDWGINPNPREFERDWVLQFSLGVAF